MHDNSYSARIQTKAISLLKLTETSLPLLSNFLDVSLFKESKKRCEEKGKRKESERHVLMLEFVRQSHLFQIISGILQDIRIKLAFNFREFQLAIVFGS